MTTIPTDAPGVTTHVGTFTDDNGRTRIIAHHYPEKPNAELAWAVLDWIDTHPEQHDQSMWVRAIDDIHQMPKTLCGTACCFAGWTALLSQPDPEWALTRFDDVHSHETTIEYDTDAYMSVMRFAQDELGITSSQADALFEAYNSFETLYELVVEYFGPRPCSSAPQ